MLLQADPDIISTMREPGFQQWLIYAFIAFVLWDKVSTRLERNKAQQRVITGTVENRESQTPALKSEVEDELDDIDQQLVDLRKHLDAKFDEVLKAGQHRADKITARIDSEITAIRQDIENRMSLVHEKINHTALHVAAHDEAIGTLKATDFRHDQVMQTMHSKIATARKPS